MNQYLKIVILLIGVALLLCIIGIIVLACLGQSIPDVLQNLSVGSLTGLVGTLTGHYATAKKVDAR